MLSLQQMIVSRCTIRSFCLISKHLDEFASYQGYSPLNGFLSPFSLLIFRQNFFTTRIKVHQSRKTISSSFISSPIPPYFMNVVLSNFWKQCSPNLIIAPSRIFLFQAIDSPLILVRKLSVNIQSLILFCSRLSLGRSISRNFFKLSLEQMYYCCRSVGYKAVINDILPWQRVYLILP